MYKIQEISFYFFYAVDHIRSTFIQVYWSNLKFNIPAIKPGPLEPILVITIQSKPWR